MYPFPISALANPQQTALLQNLQTGASIVAAPYVRHDAQRRAEISVTGQQEIDGLWRAMSSYTAVSTDGKQKKIPVPMLKTYFEALIRNVPGVDTVDMAESVRTLMDRGGFCLTTQKIAIKQAQEKFDSGMNFDYAGFHILESLKKNISASNRDFVNSLRSHFKGRVFNNEAPQVLHDAAKRYAASGGDLNQVGSGGASKFFQVLKNHYVPSDAARETLRIFLEETPAHVEERFQNGPSIVLRHGAVDSGQQAVQGGAMPFQPQPQSQSLERRSHASKRSFDHVDSADQNEPSQRSAGAQKKTPRAVGEATIFTRMPDPQAGAALEQPNFPSSFGRNPYHDPVDFQFPDGGAMPPMGYPFLDGFYGAGHSDTQLSLHGPNRNPATSTNAAVNPTTSMTPSIPRTSAFQPTVPMPSSAHELDPMLSPEELKELLDMLPVDSISNLPIGHGSTGSRASIHTSAVLDPSVRRWQDQRSNAALANVGDVRPPQVDYSRGDVPYSTSASAQDNFNAWNLGLWSQSSLPPMPSLEDFLREFDAKEYLQNHR